MHEDDFLLSGYEHVLRAALDGGYAFASFADIGREAAPRTCLLRHDVDSELLGCEPMLAVERALGVRATYFVMLRSTAYNLFSVEGRSMVGRILADGHRIGLHFMGELCERDAPAALSQKVRREADWLESEFGQRIDAVSFHQPSRAVLDGEVRVPDLVNTYNRAQMGEYFYVSDTNMQWRHEHPLEIFGRALYPRLHLLIHPMWWTPTAMDTAGKWRSVLELNRRAVLEHWKARERTLKDVDLDGDD